MEGEPRPKTFPWSLQGMLSRTFITMAFTKILLELDSITNLERAGTLPENVNLLV